MLPSLMSGSLKDPSGARCSVARVGFMVIVLTGSWIVCDLWITGGPRTEVVPTANHGTPCEWRLRFEPRCLWHSENSPTFPRTFSFLLLFLGPLALVLFNSVENVSWVQLLCTVLLHVWIRNWACNEGRLRCPMLIVRNGCAVNGKRRGEFSILLACRNFDCYIWCWSTLIRDLRWSLRSLHADYTRLTEGGEEGGCFVKFVSMFWYSSRDFSFP